MNRLIDTMAYTGQTPWHGLGSALPAAQPVETWAKAAGMDWTIRETPVRFVLNDADTAEGICTEQKVLYRSDCGHPLSVVGSRYRVVQPREVLEFYRDLTETAGYELETAGVLKGGRKFWALAKTGQSKALAGNDVVNGYLLLATSCDGSLATVATPTTVRVVCNNTLTTALDGLTHAVRVGHRSAFDADAVKRQLGIAVSQWDGFMYRMKALSERKVRTQEAKRFFSTVFADTPVAGSGVLQHQEKTVQAGGERAMKKALSLYEGHGRGSSLTAAKGTAWGLLCAVTEYVDHEKQARSAGNRLDSAWFGQGAGIKQRALEQAVQLAA